jgi:riboflavin-specific deaminase-like protein
MLKFASLSIQFIFLAVVLSTQQTVAHQGSSGSLDLATATVQTIIDRISSWKEGHDHLRPFVTLSYAQSLDGKIAVYVDENHIETSSNFPISGHESLLMTHGLRSIHDAILVGGKTLGIDNPRLSNRLWGDGETPHQPRPVVLDTHLRYLNNLGFLCRAKNLIVCCSEEAALKCNECPPGVTLLPSQLDEDGTIDIDLLLRTLWNDFGIQSVMVEGGCKVLGAFAERNLVDCLCVTISPKILGKKGLPVFANLVTTRFDLTQPLFFSIGADNVLLSQWFESVP